LKESEANSVGNEKAGKMAVFGNVSTKRVHALAQVGLEKRKVLSHARAELPRLDREMTKMSRNAPHSQFILSIRIMYHDVSSKTLIILLKIISCALKETSR